MLLRSISKGGARCVLARTLLLAPVAAVMLCCGMPADALLLDAAGVGGSAITATTDDHRFDGVGRIECLDPISRTTTHQSTGWLIGGADTVVTAAHIFFPEAASGSASSKVVDPTHCRFVLYDRDQKVSEIASIRYAVSPWAEKRFRSDSSYDVAVLKLDRAMKVADIPAIKASGSVEKASIDLIAFHSGVLNAQLARITRGQQHAFPVGQQRYDTSALRITSASRLFSTSANSTPGSSGGMYYDERLRAAVGVHLGSVCDQIWPRYDRDICFNYGLRFNAAIVAMVDLVAHDQPQNSQLVTANDNGARLALALGGLESMALSGNTPLPPRP